MKWVLRRRAGRLEPMPWAGNAGSSRRNLAGFAPRRRRYHLFPLRIPVDADALPIRLGRHHAGHGMREAVVDGGARGFARAHGVEPVFQMMRVVIVRTDGVGARSAGNLHDFRSVRGRAHGWRREVSRLRDVASGIGLVVSAFSGQEEQRGALTSEVVDGSVRALDAAKAAVAVAERSGVGVDEALRVGEDDT